MMILRCLVVVMLGSMSKSIVSSDDKMDAMLKEVRV